MKKQYKAVSLISGGLDSMLATQLMLDQGIHIEGLNFYTGFCHSGHTSAIRKQRNPKKHKRNDALWVAEQLGIKLHIIDIVEEYKSIVINPQYGYGQHINPCLDCKVFMVKKAREWMGAKGFDFIITGEVIGQRPKSQRKHAMPIVAKQSGAFDLLVRPLCAKNLAPTLPEQKKWIDRELLKDFSGRSRKPQLNLANEKGIEEFAQPSGGCCVLTDASYAHKMQDMWKHRGCKNYDLDDVILLKVGRHIRPNERFKLIVSREEGEELFLEGYRQQFTHLKTVDFNGALVLIEGEPNAEDIHLAARLTARFSQGKQEDNVKVDINTIEGAQISLEVSPLKPDEIPKEWYL